MRELDKAAAEIGVDTLTGVNQLLDSGLTELLVDFIAVNVDHGLGKIQCLEIFLTMDAYGAQTTVVSLTSLARSSRFLISERLSLLSAWLMDHEEFFAVELKKYEEKNNVKIL